MYSDPNIKKVLFKKWQIKLNTKVAQIFIFDLGIWPAENTQIWSLAQEFTTFKIAKLLFLKKDSFDFESLCLTNINNIDDMAVILVKLLLW